jgi:hypothetical protein
MTLISTFKNAAINNYAEEFENSWREEQSQLGMDEDRQEELLQLWKTGQVALSIRLLKKE